MADDEQFSLCWNNFNSNLSAGFHESLCRGDLVDVTLAAEGQFVKAHRLVLSVCSPYFRRMFTQMPSNQHAFVFLKDVSHTALKDLIQFMYCGEVNVKQEALPAFISTAEALQIKGLTDSDPPPSQSPPEPSTPTPQLQPISSPRGRQRTSTSRSYKIETVDDSGDDKSAATQIVIQTAAPPQATVVQQSQQHQPSQQVATAATTAAVVSHKRPAQRSVGSAPHIKRTKSTATTSANTIDPLEATDQGVTTQQITVQTAVVSAADVKGSQQSASETEYIDLPIELPTKSEPDYSEEAGDGEGGDHETTYVEDDSYGELRYEESYFTENEDGGVNTTAASTGTTGSNATTSKALVKQQIGSFSDSSYAEAADQANSDAQDDVLLVSQVTPNPNIRRPRGRPPKFRKNREPQEKLFDKIAAAKRNYEGEPAIYVSTTKGSMKVLYDGHHFKYLFRKGEHSIFQCCYKENREQCKVRVVSDQKRIYPLDGEHVHFVQATDKSVTSLMFETAATGNSCVSGNSVVVGTGVQQESPVTIQTDGTSLIVLQGSPHKSRKQRLLTNENSAGQLELESAYITEATNAPATVKLEAPEEAEDPHDFRERIKKRLQKALMGKKK